MYSNQKGPLTPKELFQKLLQSDYKEIQCIDEASKIKSQRDILIQLIIQYESQIQNARIRLAEENVLLQHKSQLICELQNLRKDRGIFETRITQEINSLRATPVQIREQASWITEINEARGRNNKMKVRIRDLMGYIGKLQMQNQRLEDQRKVITTTQMNKRKANDNWRAKIGVLQKQHLTYQSQLRMKMKEKEQMALRSMKEQELEIRQRNRNRMQSMTSNAKIIPYQRTYQSKYYRQI